MRCWVCGWGWGWKDLRGGMGRRRGDCLGVEVGIVVVCVGWCRCWREGEGEGGGVGWGG